MKKRLVFLVLIFSIKSYSQISFEKGYFINNSDEKIECFIKNSDWKNNPKKIKYKLNENAIVNIAEIQSIKEFEINNASKFIRRKVEIDTSNNKVINRLSRNRAPLLKEEEVLLKVLVEGKASLYFYGNGNLKKYFFSVDNSGIQSLVHKKYLNSEDKILYNNRYKQQLLNNLSCKELGMNEVNKVEYKKKKLISFFEKYNKCVNSKTKNFEENSKRNFFDFTLRLGVSNSSLIVDEYEYSSVQKNNYIGSYDLGSKLNLNFGAVFEYIPPFNKNKWSLFVEPVYRSFESNKKRILFPDSVFEKEGYITVNYSSLELFFGIKHYMFLTDDLSLFISGSYVKDIISEKSSIDFESGVKLEMNDDSNMAFGLGTKYKKKYSLEFRFQTKRHLLRRYYYWSSSYGSYSMIFGYKLF